MKNHLFFEDRKLEALVQEGRDMIGILSAEGNYQYVSPSSMAILGIAPESFIGQNAFAFVHPDDLEKVQDAFSLLFTSANRIPIPLFRFKDEAGQWRWIDTIATNLLDDPVIEGIVVNSRDVTAAYLKQQLDDADKEIMALTIAGTLSSQEIITRYLKKVEAILAPIQVSLLQVKQGRLYNIASPSLDPTYLHIIEGMPIGFGVGSCGTAAYLKQKVIVSDINTDPLWENYKAFALAAGLQACWSHPVFNSKGDVIATFANYYQSPKVPSGFELEMFERTTALIGVILENYEKGRIVQETNERYLLATQATSDVIWDLDLIHNKIIWADSFSTVFGYSPHAFTTLEQWEELIHPEDIKRVREGFALAVATEKESWSDEYRLKKPDNSYAYVRDRGFIVRDASGKATRMVGAMADVSSLKLAERKLADERNLLKLLVDTLPDYIYVKDSEARHILNNKKMVELLGASSEEETLHKTLDAFLPPAHAAMYINDDRAILDSGIPVIDKVEPLYRKDGSINWLNTTKLPLFNDGSVTGLVCISRDITESYRLTRERECKLTINRIFNNEADLQLCLQHVLAEYCSYFQQDAAEIWLTEIDRKRIRLSGFYAADGIEPEETKVVSFLKGEGVPGSCWEKKVPVHIAAINESKSLFKRKNDAYYSRFTKATALPVIHQEEVVAVLLFFDKGNEKPVDVPLQLSPAMHAQLASDLQRKKSEYELHLFFTYSPELLCIAGADGYFKKVNPAFSTLLGYTEEEMLNHSFIELVHPDDVASTMEVLAVATTQHQPARSFQNRFRTKAGTWKWISWSSSDMMEDGGLVFGYGKDITGEKEMQRLLDSATQLARIGSWEIDLVQQTVYWSPITRLIHEADDHFIPDINVGINFYRADVRDEVMHIIQNSIENNVPFDFEKPIITSKGRECWIRAIGKPEFLDGKCIKVVGSFQDIHQRKITELSLQKAYNEKNEILESIGDAFFAADNHFIVTYWNAQAEKMINTPREQIVGKNLWDVFPDAVELASYQNYHKVLREKVTIQFEDYYAPVNRWLEVSAYPSINGISVYFRDITEQKQMQQRIMQERNLLRSLIDNLPDTIYYKDNMGRKLISNKMDYTLLGAASEEEVLGKTDLELVPGEKGINGYERDMHIIRTRQPLVNNESRFKDSDGKELWLLTTKLPLFSADGKVAGLLGIGRNITPLKIVENELRDLNKELEQRVKELAISNTELEQFAFVASHDLQEPLRMITSFLALLEKKYADQLDEKAHEYIHFAVDGAKRMRQIILDLLEFSRINKYTDVKEHVALQEVIKEVCVLQKKSIEEKQAVIHTGSLPVLQGYKTPFLQIFNNLISNALKYSKEGVAPMIEIGAEDQGTEWLFSVQDNGIGIDKNYYEKIFIIFQRLHGKKQYEGTGMGLAIVKKIIEGMGGKIWVNSEEGRGSTFFFTFKKA